MPAWPPKTPGVLKSRQQVLTNGGRLIKIA
jgi:hypothetical protein